MKVDFKYMLIIRSTHSRELAYLPLIDELSKLRHVKSVTMHSSVNEYIFCIKARYSVYLDELSSVVKNFSLIATESSSIVLLSLGISTVYITALKKASSFMEVKNGGLHAVNITCTIGMIKGVLQDINTCEKVPKFLKEFESNYLGLTLQNYIDASGIYELETILLGYSPNELFLVKPRFILSSLQFFI